MTDLSAAAQALRASVEALPRGDRNVWASGEIESGALVDEHGLVMLRLGRELKPHVDHIALAASPDRVLLLAELLNAEAADRSFDAKEIPQDADLAAIEEWARPAAEATIRRNKAMDALAASILGGAA